LLGDQHPGNRRGLSAGNTDYNIHKGYSQTAQVYNKIIIIIIIIIIINVKINVM